MLRPHLTDGTGPSRVTEAGIIPTARIPDVLSRPEPRGACRCWSVVGCRHGRARMTIAVTRRELDAGGLRREAARCRDARAARRMLALALVLEGASRAEAARAAGMDRQTLPDWVHRYNAEGPAGLRHRPRSGRRPRLSPEQEAELAAAVERGPDPDRDGVVRWRRIDPKALIETRFAVRLHERTGTRGKTPGTSKPLIELIFSNITTSPTRGCEEVLHRIAQRPIAIYSGAKVINPNIFLRLLLNFQLAPRNRQTISIRGAE